MKAIIDGKTYNTATAEEIETYSNGLTFSDFGYLSEALYRTKKGAFFLYGDGGAFTKYAVRIGNGSCGGRRIIPLTVDEAKRWMETHGSVDGYIYAFGEPDEA